jgi:hypothetical protein
MNAALVLAAALLASVATRFVMHLLLDGELRASRADNAALRAERKRLRFDIATVTADRDSARAACASWHERAERFEAEVEIVNAGKRDTRGAPVLLFRRKLGRSDRGTA